jgi:septal ring factor EnvC (AmiA/AmiB activator)
MKFFLQIIIGLCLNMWVYAEESSLDTKNKESELESIRFLISNVQNNIKEAESKSESLQLELKQNEIAAAETLINLSDIENQIKEKGARLQKLEKTKILHQGNLARERKYLVYQIRTAYKIGRNDYLKLLLNQENPALVGRVLAYYDYQNRARVDRINTVTQQLDTLNHVEKTINNETKALRELKSRQVDKLEEFNTFRTSRKEIISRLQNYIEQQDTQLTLLQKDEHELENLLQKLRDEKADTIEIYEDIPPFNSLKGKLRWPTTGKITNRFGRTKKGGKLKWQGVILDADAGTEVHAISSGKIVFADWFRNLGLLIILDHGDGFMSLYGHNQSLAKKPGDWVLVGETIASVGDSGGQSQSGLYFEIRKDGTPLNPSNWCQKVTRR